MSEKCKKCGREIFASDRSGQLCFGCHKLSGSDGADKRVRYTEGPWVSVRQRGRFDGNYNIQQASRRGMLMSFVKIFGPNDLVHPDFAERAEANAQLISLSPELAYMLEWLTGSCEGLLDQGTMLSGGPFAHAVEQARALLEKLDKLQNQEDQDG